MEVTITEFLKQSGKYLDEIEKGKKVTMTTRKRGGRIVKIEMKLKEDNDENQESN